MSFGSLPYLGGSETGLLLCLFIRSQITALSLGHQLQGASLPAAYSQLSGMEARVGPFGLPFRNDGMLAAVGLTGLEAMPALLF